MKKIYTSIKKRNYENPLKKKESPQPIPFFPRNTDQVKSARFFYQIFSAFPSCIPSQLYEASSDHWVLVWQGHQ